jgi:hypothetical protein
MVAVHPDFVRSFITGPYRFALNAGYNVKARNKLDNKLRPRDSA